MECIVWKNWRNIPGVGFGYLAFTDHFNFHIAGGLTEERMSIGVAHRK
jgi:hypothetical protein